MSAFTGPLAIVEFDVDDDLWAILQPLIWEVGALGSGVFITVPVGFISDGASIPWPLSIVLHRWGRWRRAACLHDWLYELLKAGTPDPNALTRAQADEIFRQALYASGVSHVLTFLFFTAVRIFGSRFLS